jgi:hypothetical protein
VTVNCVLIGKGVEATDAEAADAEAPFGSTLTEKNALSPKSVVPRVETASMSAASWFASA